MNNIEKMIKEDYIYVNNKVVKASYKLKLADISLIDGGYFFCAEYFFMYSNISFCIFVHLPSLVIICSPLLIH